MTHPTPIAAPEAPPLPLPGERMGMAGFSLATLAARIMLGMFLFFTLLTAVPWFFTRGPEVAFGVLISALLNILILTVFALLLPLGNRVLATVFALWCAWGLIDSFSGASNTFVAIVGYAHGVLNFVGIVGVVKGWPGKTTT